MTRINIGICLLAPLLAFGSADPGSPAIPAPGSSVADPSAIGIGLIPPRLVQTDGRDAWIGAAIEERFYHAGRFSSRGFVPDPEQFHSLLANCPLQDAAKCHELIAEKLKLEAMVGLEYKPSGNDFVAEITIRSTAVRELDAEEPGADSLDGAAGSSRRLRVQAPSTDPIAFVAQCVRTIFTALLPGDSLVLREISAFPSRRPDVYGCYAVGLRKLAEGEMTDVFYPLLRSRQLDPDFIPASALVAKANLRLGRAAQGLAELENAGKGGGWETDMVRAELLLALKRPREAFAALESAKAKLPFRTAEWEYLAGRYYHAIYAFPRAVSHLISAIHKNPSASAYYQALGETYSASGNFQAAIPIFRRLVRLAPDDKYHKLFFGLCLRDNGELGEAIRTFQEILVTHPDFFPARLNLGICYERLGWHLKAERAFEAAIQQRQDTVDAAVNLAVLKIRTGRSREGEALLRRVYTRHPGNEKALLNLGILTLSRGEPKIAERFLKEALSANPSNSVALLNLARVHHALGRERLEFESLHRVLELEPENAGAQRQLAQYHARRSEWSEALEVLRAAMESRPDSYEERLLAARYLHRIGDRAGADRHLDLVRDRFANSADVQLELAGAYFDLRRFQDAILIAEKLLRSAYSPLECHLLLGKSFTEQIVQGQSRRLDAAEQAPIHLAQAIEKAPEDWRGHFWLARFLAKVKRDESAAAKESKKASRLAKKHGREEDIRRELAMLSNIASAAPQAAAPAEPVIDLDKLDWVR